MEQTELTTHDFSLNALRKARVHITLQIFLLLWKIQIYRESPRTVLIEGAPGLGKSILLKQIAYEWAQNNQLVNSKFVFLLLLRDPHVRAMSSISDLVQYFYKKSPEVHKLYADRLSDEKGKNVTFLLDGYDELPPQERGDSFIAKIIAHNCKELPFAAVVISSRPHASTRLRSSAVCLTSYSSSKMHSKTILTN